jgi:hypothetical protein
VCGRDGLVYAPVCQNVELEPTFTNHWLNRPCGEPHLQQLIILSETSELALFARDEIICL